MLKTQPNSRTPKMAVTFEPIDQFLWNLRQTLPSQREIQSLSRSFDFLKTKMAAVAILEIENLQ